MQNFKSNKHAKGFNLLELMLVLAAIVVLGAFVFNQYNKYRIGEQASNDAQALATAATGIKALYTSGNYTTLSPTVAANAKFFPDNMTDGSTIINPYQGTVVLGPVDTSAGVDDAVPNITAGSGSPSATNTKRYFGISYPNVPSAVCIKLAGAASGAFDKIGIGGQVVKNTVPGATTRRLLDETRVTTQCGQDTTVTMVFITS